MSQCDLPLYVTFVRSFVTKVYCSETKLNFDTSIIFAYNFITNWETDS